MLNLREEMRRVVVAEVKEEERRVEGRRVAMRSLEERGVEERLALRTYFYLQGDFFNSPPLNSFIKFHTITFFLEFYH